MSPHTEPEKENLLVTDVRIWWDKSDPENQCYKYQALSYGELKDCGIMDQTTISEAIDYAIWWLGLDVTSDHFAIDSDNGGYAIWTAPPFVVGHTANGREIRQLFDGTFEVQSPNDNYWIKGKTQEEALIKSGWIKSQDLVELELRLQAIDDAIDKFTEACQLFSISEIRDGNVPDPIVPSVWFDAAKALSKCRNQIYDELGRKESGL